MDASPAAAGLPPALRGHLPVLDGVRGLAVMMVLVFHFVGSMLTTNPVERTILAVAKQGVIGVDLFFVLSGFLITGLLYDAREKPHCLRDFYVRRALRIFPLYYGVLLLVFFVAPQIPYLQGPTLNSLVERQGWAWLYAVNAYLAGHDEWSFSYLNHFWSLSVEEHFYLFWPCAVLLLAGRARALILLSLAISFGAMLARIIGLMIGLNWWTTIVLTPFKLDGLALGAAVALIARQPGGFERLVGALPRVAGVSGALVVMTFVWTGLVSREGLEIMGAIRAALFQIMLACLLVWILVAPEASALSRFFRSRGMVFLGTYSYGLYVYHHFFSYYFASNRTELELAAWVGSHGLAVALQAALGTLASVAVAVLSYELLEKRILRLKSRFGGTGEEIAPPVRDAHFAATRCPDARA
ncbi:acyltransferase [Bradyrhizobium sp. ORS 375]|uniref:acyltransferase family protein n=1 Tax=Bradyrhizobium sp. (strain ORS 375) TaxID=566679 RepID=UPI001584D75F|nr:acyltransferase [Bradyrhizobium sp. ORS 375]